MIDVSYYARRTNGMVFDRDCNPLTEMDYPDLYYYDRDAALWVKEFIETVGTITEDGHHFKKGDPIRLLDWQIQTVCNLFGVKVRETGLRRYWNVVHLLPKKQGKSPFSAMLSLVLLCADGQGTAEIFTVACDKAQAGIIHNNAKKMVKASDFLNEVLTIRMQYIEHESTESRFWITSAIEDSKHGPNLSGICFDEPHAYAKWTLPETLEQGIMARAEPVVIYSSTAGEKNTPFYNKVYKNAKGLLNGTIRNDTELVFIYEADREALEEKYGDSWEEGNIPWWARPEVHADVNPSYGVTCTARYFENEVTKVKNGTRSLNKFLQMHLNIFTGTTESWSITKKWKGLLNGSPKVTRRGWGSIYVGKPQDVTCGAMFFEDGRLEMIFMMTQESYELRKITNPEVEKWVSEGWVRIAGTNYIGIDKHICIFKEYFGQYDVIDIGYRAGDEGVAVKLTEEMSLQQRRLSIKASLDIINATRHFEEMVNSKHLKHDGNPVLSYMIEMTEIDTRDDNNRPSQKDSGDNICGVYGALLAAHGDYKAKEQTNGIVDNGILYVKNIF